eukprot:765422-Hanusia_phi.AAC.1
MMLKWRGDWKVGSAHDGVVKGRKWGRSLRQKGRMGNRGVIKGKGPGPLSGYPGDQCHSEPRGVNDSNCLSNRESEKQTLKASATAPDFKTSPIPESMIVTTPTHSESQSHESCAARVSSLSSVGVRSE